MKALTRYTATAVSLALLMACQSKPEPSGAEQDWPIYGGDAEASQFSNLVQINPRNVHTLSLAWRYDSAHGADIPVASELQVNPLIIDGILYGRNPNYNVFAIDAQTGKELWTHTPNAQYAGLSYMRGLTMHRGDKLDRLFFSTGHWLHCVDAKTGIAVAEFGENGVVDLRKGLGKNYKTVSINAPSPGVVFEDLLIMGSAVLETEGAAPGHVRAYDVNTGDIAWTFKTIPDDGDFGSDTWPKETLAAAGGANAWAGMSVDVKRETVYVPTGSPTPDFDGTVRHGKNLFGNSVLALNARTGERRWHYQTVHHDIWDRDLSSQPTLATINFKGQQRDVVIQASKQGVLYVLDRDSGEPIFPIEEVAVPASDLPGEQAWPTQPKVSLPEPFSRQHFSVDELSNLDAQTHDYVLKQFEQAQSFAYFRPIGLRKTILFPGFYGGGNWGGGAFNPDTGVYFINGTEVPAMVHYQSSELKNTDLGDGERTFLTQCAGCHGMELKGFYPYAPSLLGIAERLDESAALSTVRNGKGRMMSFAHLEQAKLKNVVSYLFHLDQRLGGTEFTVDESEDTQTTYTFAGYHDFLDQNWYPAVKPPWGTLNAIDIASGKRLWQIPLGEHAELSAKGIEKTGTRNYGGPIVTASGLVVIAATMDAKLRIFSAEGGELLWEYQLPAAGYATPASYSVNGRQYIVVAAPGGKLGSPAGDAYLAFALPQSP